MRKLVNMIIYSLFIYLLWYYVPNEILKPEGVFEYDGKISIETYGVYYIFSAVPIIISLANFKYINSFSSEFSNIIKIVISHVKWIIKNCFKYIYKKIEVMDRIKLVFKFLNNNMTKVSEWFKYQILSEPLRTLIRNGLCENNGSLSESGKDAFMSFMLEKYGDEFAKQIRDFEDSKI